MNIVRTGIIINTEKYQECVSFYRDLFGLKRLFCEQDDDFKLTCFEFGGSYLMIETDGFAEPQGKSIQENSTRLRFNVADLEEALVALSDFGIDAEITRNDWGDTINLYDPDGNRVGIRDEISFKAQIEV